MTAVDLQPGVPTPAQQRVKESSGGLLGVIRANYDLLVAPIIVVLILVVMVVYVGNQSLDTIEERALEPANVFGQLGQHLLLTAYSTVLVLVIAVPLGIVLSRPGARRIQGAVLALGGFAQALPPFGVLLLLGFWEFGVRSAVIGLTLAALLPVLRNTVVGLQQVDQALIEAARGMGMSARQTLFRVEIPLAVPVIVAGLRVALVLNVGTATLATYIGAGGLGELVQQALRLNRINLLFVSGAIIAALALLIDWLAGVAERAIVARSG
ncbi:ABC transporter permease [Actinomycetospora sp. NBRC 106378]|uniref:ABC transporter permease n=1 Tax=Actinomycetospora sp. NBRC 106378 TaxID=3032208 RepID=UPI0024A49A27|nr:ABC transporter permease [Actinomycetospora sp. NBRC 106378]GLZ56153.1 ABC transporter permease [Actinomycetospora sp. NBRC 106378]